MKKTLIIITAMLLTTLAASAQVIRKGNKFFDGEMLWTVVSAANGQVKMTGTDGQGLSSELYLEKKGTRAGIYKIVRRGQQLVPLFHTQWDAEVQYVRQNGMNFLAVSDGKGNITEILTLTVDNIKNLRSQQASAEEEGIFDSMHQMLLNSHILEAQRRTIDDVIYYAGLLDKQSNLSVVERYNQKLLRGYAGYAKTLPNYYIDPFSNPDGLGGDGRGADEINQNN